MAKILRYNVTATIVPVFDIAPEQITDLTIAATASTTVTLRWTEVDDGSKRPARYAIRDGTPTIVWDDAAATEEIIFGRAIGDTIEHTVTGLTDDIQRQFQVRALRLDADDEELGPLSNVTTAYVSGGETFVRNPDDTFILSDNLDIIAIDADAQTFYVDADHPSASDSNAGTSEAAPWATITHAAATLKAGETVLVKDRLGGAAYVNNSGTWSNPGDWNPANSGTAGSPITFRAFTGHQPLLRSTLVDGSVHTVIGASNRNYIIWDGFEIDQMRITKSERACYLNNSDNSTIQNCEIHGLRGEGKNNTDGIRMDFCANSRLYNNLIYDIRNAGSSPNGSAVKQYGNEDCIIEHNEVYDCDAGLRNKSRGQRTIFRYNWVHDITNYCINIKSGDDECYANLLTDGNQGVHVANISQFPTPNTAVIYNNTIARMSSRGVDITAGTPAGVSVYNCIFVDAGSLDNQVTTCDNNWYFNMPADCGSDGTADPEFVNAALTDPLHAQLQGTSPCIDEGRNGTDDLGCYILGTETIGRE